MVDWLAWRPLHCVPLVSVLIVSSGAGSQTSLSVLQRKKRGAEQEGIEGGSAMLEIVISIPAIFLVILLALGCYLLGRNRGRAEAAAAPQQFAPPAPPPGLTPKQQGG
ncbi:unnamed protein product [Urochloa decumbens]|uniref:Uncharacterized protein n=1 Tax=Urochloa decumbens TaxID=240449 RepID=A0ABC9D450_9POAL